MPVDLDLLVDLSNMTQPGDHIAGDRLVGTLRQGDAGLLGEILEVEQAVHFDIAGAEAAGRPPAPHVALVSDVADELLDKILEGHDAGGASILVDDDREMLSVALHFGEGRQDALGRGEQHDVPREVPDPDGPTGKVRVEQVTDMYETEHIIV